MNIKSIIISGLIIISPVTKASYNDTPITVDNVILTSLASFVLMVEGYCIYFITNDIYQRINKDPNAPPTKIMKQSESHACAIACPVVLHSTPTSGYYGIHEKTFDDYASEISDYGLKILLALVLIDYGVAAYQYCTKHSSVGSETR